MATSAPSCGSDARVCPAGHGAAPSPSSWRCERCGAPYELRPWNHPTTTWPSSGAGVWRYANWLPSTSTISLGEPPTPLVELPSDRGDLAVVAKLEGSLPTGSFKDRGSAVVAGWLQAVGAREVVIDSSGNAGASLAAYCAAVGIRCTVYVPAAASPNKLVQVRAYGAEVIRIAGSRADTTEAAVKAADGAVYASHMWNPYFLAGTQTFAFELVEQLREAPAAVVFPLGAGTLLLGSYFGFRGLRDAGLIGRLPRLFGVQAGACSPLVDAFESGEQTATGKPCGRSLAEGILIARPPRGDAVLAAAGDSGGSILSVSEQEIRAAFHQLAHLGVYVEPTSAVAAAGLKRVLAQAGTQLEGQVVIALTGTGLKATGVAEQLLESEPHEW